MEKTERIAAEIEAFKVNAAEDLEKFRLKFLRIWFPFRVTLLKLIVYSTVSTRMSLRKRSSFSVLL